MSSRKEETEAEGRKDIIKVQMYFVVQASLSHVTQMIGVCLVLFFCPVTSLEEDKTLIIVEWGLLCLLRPRGFHVSSEKVE